MRLKVLVFFFLLFAFLKLVSPASAVRWPIEGGINFELPIMGMTCGLPGTPHDECCRTASPVKINIITPDVPLVDKAFEPLANLLEFIVNHVIGDFSQQILKFDQKINELKGPIGQDKSYLYCVPGAKAQSSSNSCVCVLKDKEILAGVRALCDNIKDPAEQGQCRDCIVKDPKDNKSAGIWTSLGCMQTDVSALIRETVFKLGIGIAGTFALLCIMYGAFSMQTSQGNPEKLKKSQELITSCIMGLILIIFSVFLLRVIGVDILGLPGFTR